MTDLTTLRAPASEPAPTPTTATAAHGPALITEQQVMFSSAAAVGVPATTRRWTDVIGSAASAVGEWFVTAAKPPRPTYQKRERVYLQSALMAREMDRL
jgi:hypothetical protein